MALTWLVAFAVICAIHRMDEVSSAAFRHMTASHHRWLTRALTCGVVTVGALVTADGIAPGVSMPARCA